LDVDKFAKEAFKRDNRIRYVGVVDNEFHILCSKMRDGVVSVTTEEEEHNFIQLMPPILVDAAEKMQPMLGKVESVTIRYEKVLLVFFRIGGVVIILSCNPTVPTPLSSALSDVMRELGAKYITQ
jgi:hypothetical protein